MIFLDKPYVSDFLLKTIRENKLPLVNSKYVQDLGFNGENYLIEEEDLIEKVKQSNQIQIYTTSENSLGWIARHLEFTGIPQKINLFKNKVRFRNLLKPIYPDFSFQEVLLDELDDLEIRNIPRPFIIKPSVGFFSMGVYKIAEEWEWEKAKQSIQSELQELKDIYPREVMDTSSFIIEECIEGDEFAVDAYFDASGTPVILNICQHYFSSREDVSDRVYISSKEIIEKYLEQFTAFLSKIGGLADVTNFPIHAELRRNKKGIIVPVEINAMRFGGWCTTADLTSFAYGFNPYLYYFSHSRPDWSEILQGKEGKLYSIVVLDNSTDIDTNKIKSFDYEQLYSKFEKVLEFRKVDFKQYPVFAFLFTETREKNFAELEWILKSDLKEFITIEKPG